MTTPGQNFDPFEQGDGVKAVSFKNAPINSVITIQIDDDAKWLQTRDFETGELAYWPARPGETPNPIMAAVVTGIVAETPWAVQSGQVGERRSVWATKPSNLFTAIQNAKRAAGGGTPLPILNGGTLDIAQTGEEPNKKNPNLNNIKLFQARYTPPPAGYGQQDAFEGNQAFAGAPAAQPAQAPQQQFGGFGQQAPAAAPVQQAPVEQQFQQAPAQPQGNPFGGQQAPAQPQGNPFGQQQPAAAGPFGQAPAQPQQPAMAGAPAASDPWGGQQAAPQGDIPPF